MKKLLLVAAAVIALMGAVVAHAEPVLVTDVLKLDRSFTLQECKVRALKTLSNNRYGTFTELKLGAGAFTKDTKLEIKCIPELKAIFFVIADNGTGELTGSELDTLIDDFQHQH
jgi:hypothetical protein